MKQSVLITGASGFVGKAVCLYFLNHGFRVIGCGQRKDIELQHDNFQYYAFDLREWGHYTHLLEQVNYVIHLAALAHQPAHVPENIFFEINTKCTQILATLCGQHKINRFIYLSSIKVNGERTHELPFCEQDIPTPLDNYSRSKWLAEQQVQEICNNLNVEWVIVRPPLIYGPDVKANFAHLIQLIDKKIPLPFKGFDNKRSFIAIDNLCDFLFSCLTNERANRQLFCISDDDDCSTNVLVEALQSVRLGSSKSFYVPPIFLRWACKLIGKQSMYCRLSESLQIDISKAKSLLNWQPKYTLKQAITRYFKKTA